MRLLRAAQLAESSPRAGGTAGRMEMLSSKQTQTQVFYNRTNHAGCYERKSDLVVYRFGVAVRHLSFPPMK